MRLESSEGIFGKSVGVVFSPGRQIGRGRYLDGRVSAVLGTHTHVPTADECIYPGGTAFQCDVGMPARTKASSAGRLNG